MAKPIGNTPTTLPPVIRSFESPLVEGSKADLVYKKQGFSRHPMNIKQCQLLGCSNHIPISMRLLTCKCGKVFCRLHRDTPEHNCGFDWGAYYRERTQAEKDATGKDYMDPGGRNPDSIR